MKCEKCGLAVYSSNDLYTCGACGATFPYSGKETRKLSPIRSWRIPILAGSCIAGLVMLLFVTHRMRNGEEQDSKIRVEIERLKTIAKDIQKQLDENDFNWVERDTNEFIKRVRHLQDSTNLSPAQAEEVEALNNVSIKSFAAIDAFRKKLLLREEERRHRLRAIELRLRVLRWRIENEKNPYIRDPLERAKAIEREVAVLRLEWERIQREQGP